MRTSPTGDPPGFRYNGKPYEAVVIYLWKEIIERIKSPGSAPTATLGKTSRLRYKSYWAFLFDINEHLPKDKKMTDYAIARNVQREFPTIKSAQRALKPRKSRGAQESVRYWRRQYNTGQLLHSRVSKEKYRLIGPVSFRFNNDGDACSSHSPTRLLTPEDIKQQIEKYSRGVPYERWEYAPPGMEFFKYRDRRLKHRRIRLGNPSPNPKAHQNRGNDTTGS
jgi:hypothetical protein